MSEIPIQLVRYDTRIPTDALLHADLSPRVLVEIEREWGPFRRGAARQLVRAGLPAQQIPSHWHWDWADKSQNLRWVGYRCLGIECEGKMQGLMMVLTVGRQSRLAPDEGEPIVYIDYLESAPWNVIPLVDVPLFLGVGTVLIRAAVRLSLAEGFLGRVALHALPQAEVFYRDRCGMQACGNDPQYQNLPYFEMTTELARQFLTA